MSIIDSGYSTTRFAGAGGRVKIGNTVIAFVSKWSASIEVSVYGADTFENPTNAAGLVFKRKDLLDMAEGKCSLEGYAVRDSTEAIVVGGAYSLELLMGKTSTRAVIGTAICTSVSYEADATGGSPVSFSAEFEFDGVVGVS